MKNKIRENLYLILTILWMTVIFLFSSQDGHASNMNNAFIVNLLKALGIDAVKLIPGINFIIRKAAHLTEYFILGMLLYKTCETYFIRWVKALSLAAGFLYACSDEIHQYFIPGRGPAVTDVLIDTSGVIAGILAVYLVYCIRQKKSKIFIGY